MKKKNISIIFSVMLIIGAFFTFVGCSSNEARTIEIVGDVYTEFEVGESVSTYLSNVVLKVTMVNGREVTITGADSKIKITGLTTAAANLNGSMTIAYDKASVQIPYRVYASSNFIYNSTDLNKITSGENTLIFKNNGVYDLSDYPITRSLTLIARITKSVTLKDVLVNNTSATDAISVVIKNVKVQQDNAAYALQYKTKNAGSTIDYYEVNNCEFIATTGSSKAICLPNSISSGYVARSNMLLTQSTFTTPTGTSYSNLFTGNGTSKSVDATITMTDNIFACNFSYGLYSTTPTLFEGNYVEGTITGAGSFQSAEANGQDYFITKKNPVWFHYDIPYTTFNASQGSVLTTVVRNNTFKNLENLMRCYRYDYLASANKLSISFTNNTYESINILLNSSQAGFTGATRFLNAMKSSTNTIVSVSQDSKAVMVKNTEVNVANLDTDNIMITSTGCIIYYDLESNLGQVDSITYTAKNGIIYSYVANKVTDAFGALLGGRSDTHVVRAEYIPEGVSTTIEVGSFYVIAVDYSADGTDNVLFYNGTGYYRTTVDAHAYTLEEVKSMTAFND